MLTAKVDHGFVDLQHQNALQTFKLNGLLNSETISTTDNANASGVLLGQQGRRNQVLVIAVFISVADLDFPVQEKHGPEGFILENFHGLERSLPLVKGSALINMTESISRPLGFDRHQDAP